MRDSAQRTVRGAPAFDDDSPPVPLDRKDFELTAREFVRLRKYDRARGVPTLRCVDRDLREWDHRAKAPKQPLALYQEIRDFLQASAWRTTPPWTNRTMTWVVNAVLDALRDILSAPVEPDRPTPSEARRRR